MGAAAESPAVLVGTARCVTLRTARRGGNDPVRAERANRPRGAHPGRVTFLPGPFFMDARDAIPNVRAVGVAGERGRVRDVGAGRVERVRRRLDARSAGGSRTARLQLLRYRMGLRAGAKRAFSRWAGARAPRAASLYGDEDSAKEPHLAVAPRFSAR